MMSKRFVLLLLFCVHLATSAAILTKRRTADEKKEDLEKLNGYRATFAKKIEIGNMHELSYDDDLEKVANSMIADCSFKNADYVLVPSVKNIEFFLQMANVVDEKLLDDEDKKIISALMHPLQTKLACFELTMECKNRDISAGHYCLIGPEKSLVSEKDYKKGPIGSHCDHGVAVNGLCKAAGSGSNSATTGMNSLIFAAFAAFVMVFY
ncbi:unnamed protein product [Caenorhabditis brenneri]